MIGRVGSSNSTEGDSPVITQPFDSAGRVLVAPDDLEALAAHTTQLGRRVEAIGSAVGAALAQLAAAAPGSALARAEPPASESCRRVLAAEADRLRQLGEQLRRAAAEYRANELRIAGNSPTATR
jgi:hypothetical protein